MTRPHLLAIAGPSGSGKSTLADALAACCANLDPFVLRMDAYYRDLSHLSPEDRAAVNFDDPAALEHGLLAEHVRALAGGQPAAVPEYDFTTHTRTGARTVRWNGCLLIVEGMLALHWPDLNRLYDSRVFVDLDDGAALARRTERDTRERGRTAESVARQFRESVAPMAAAHCRPTRAAADLVLDGAGDRMELLKSLFLWLFPRL